MGFTDGSCVPSTERESGQVMIVQTSKVDFEVQLSFTEIFQSCLQHLSPPPIVLMLMLLDKRAIQVKAMYIQKRLRHIHTVFTLDKRDGKLHFVTAQDQMRKYRTRWDATSPDVAFELAV